MSDRIIDKLSKIEGDVNRLMEEAAEKKQQMSREFEEKKKDCSRRTAQELEQNIERFRSETKEASRIRFQSLREAADQEMRALTEDYETNHIRYVRDLFWAMIGEEDAETI